VCQFRGVAGGQAVLAAFFEGGAFGCSGCAAGA
jgi:hypothetical protein